MFTRSLFVRTAACVLMSIASGKIAFASQEPTNNADADAALTFTVAVRDSPPFLMQGDDGTWTGIAGDLWTTLEPGLTSPTGIRPVYVAYDSLSDQLDAVANGDADMALGGFTVTAERERAMDFTHPMLSDGLAIAVPAASGPAWLNALRGLISPQFFGAIGALMALLLAVGFVVWLLERRGNPDQFGGTASRGLASGFWWSAVTMTTVGYGDKAPATFLGRSVALVWMFTSIIIISSMTAAIASALTISSLGGRVQDASDLPGARVGTVAGSASETYLRRVGARPVYAKSSATLVELLNSDNAPDAIVYDGPVLRYLINQSGTQAAVLPGTVEAARYAWALPTGSPMREAINRAILETTASPEWRSTLSRYLGSE